MLKIEEIYPDLEDKVRSEVRRFTKKELFENLIHEGYQMSERTFFRFMARVFPDQAIANRISDQDLSSLLIDLKDECKYFTVLVFSYIWKNVADFFG